MDRGPSKHRRLVLQDRDRHLLYDLGTAGTLDTNAIWMRHFPQDKTGQSCRRRLALLHKHRLVQRTFIEVSSACGTGRAPVVYHLTPQGAAALELNGSPHRLRTAYGDRLSVVTLRHRSGIGNIVLAVNYGCRQAGLPVADWLLEYDLRPNAPKKARFSERFLLCHEFKVSDGGRTKCWPDAACQLTYAQGGHESRLVMLFEYDRSTEDHPQLLEKLPGYAVLFETQAYLQYWPQASRAHLFFVLQNIERLGNVAESFRAGPLADRIRLGIADELVANSPITAPVWFTTSLERRALIAS